MFYLILLSSSARSVTTFDSTTTTVANQLICAYFFSVCIYCANLIAAWLTFVSFLDCAFWRVLFWFRVGKHFCMCNVEIVTEEKSEKKRARKKEKKNILIIARNNNFSVHNCHINIGCLSCILIKYFMFGILNYDSELNESNKC